MRPGQQKQRSRGRGNNGGGNNPNGGGNNQQRKGQNPLTRTYDSSGPDVKIRGTAQHIAEKYMALARDATSSGDRVMAENYLQHAEHYNRIIAAAQAMFQERFQRDDRSEAGDRQDFVERDEDDNDTGIQESSDAETSQQPDIQPPQPDIQPQPRQERQERRERPERGERTDRGERPERSERPDRAERPERQPRQHQPQPLIDASTPQPVIEGTPAEVQMEQESASTEAAAPGKAPRRRSAGRPRRQPRGAEAGSESEAQPAEEPAE